MGNCAFSSEAFLYGALFAAGITLALAIGATVAILVAKKRLGNLVDDGEDWP